MKNRIILSLVSFYWIALLGYSQASYAQYTVLSNYKAQYDVKYDGVKIGQSTTTLLINSKQYKYCINNTTTVPFIHGSVLECSMGRLFPNKVQPQQYTYDYVTEKKQQHISINFYWGNGTAVTRVNGLPWRMNITDGTQDRLSYQLALRLALASGEQNFNYQVADGGKIKTYQFNIISKDIIKTSMGTFSTQKLIRQPIPGKENVTLWVTNDFRHMVVKVEQQKHIFNTGTAEITALS